MKKWKFWEIKRWEGRGRNFKNIFLELHFASWKIIWKGDRASGNQDIGRLWRKNEKTMKIKKHWETGHENTKFCYTS